MQVDGGFWLGLVLGGLIGVAFDLWKRPLDRLLDRRLEHRTSSRVDVLAQRALASPDGLRVYLVEVILQTTLIGSMIGIIAGLAFGVNQVLSYMWAGEEYFRYSWILGAFGVIGQAASIMGAAYIVRIAGNALSVARRLNAFNNGHDQQE